MRYVFVPPCRILVAFFWRNYLAQMIAITEVKVYHVTRKYLQVIPYFDGDLKKQIEECILWQETKNVKTDPVWYCDNDNSLFGKVHPLFRKIGLDPKPVSNSSTKMYLMKLLLQYQKEAKLSWRKIVCQGRHCAAGVIRSLDCRHGG